MSALVLPGPLLDALGRPWIFWVPLITTLAALAATVLLVPESPARSPGRIDRAGGILLTIGLVGLLLAVSGEDLIASADLPDELRVELRRQLTELGVDLVLGTSLVEEPPTEPGEHGAFSATTRSGRRITADIWFRCYGVTPTTDYLAAGLASARLPNGHLEVTPELRLPGSEHVFAIGDVTAVPEAQMAKAAELHAAVAVANIRALAEGGDTLTAYAPGPPGISLPLGPLGGASYAQSVGVLGAEQTSQLKGIGLRRDIYTKLLNLD